MRLTKKRMATVMYWPVVAWEDLSPPLNSTSRPPDCLSDFLIKAAVELFAGRPITLLEDLSTILSSGSTQSGEFRNINQLEIIIS